MLTYITHLVDCSWFEEKSMLTYITLGVFGLHHPKYADLHHPSSCLILIWKTSMLTYITHRCLWIASYKVSWLKSLMQLVSLNFIIRNHADLHNPSSCLLLIWRRRKKYADLHDLYVSLNCFIQSMLSYISHEVACSWFEENKHADLNHPAVFELLHPK